LYPRFHEAGRALSAQGVNFHDCSMVFAESREPLYIDHCHFKARGNEILAARIAEVFLTSLPPANESAHAASGR
jgi:lysophospholipase L1-like esterase